MKKQLLALAALGLLAGAAQAQSSFEGFYGQLATGYENTTIGSGTVTAQGAGTSGSANQNSASGSNAPLIAGLGYTMMLDKSFSLGLGADYSFFNLNTGTVTSTPQNKYGDYGNSFGYYFQVSNRANFYLTPGYAIDKDKLVYLKAGYSMENIQGKASVGSGATSTSTVGGYILGLGYKQMITSGFYGFAEANYMSYSKPNYTVPYGSSSPGYTATFNPGTPTAYNILAGVGYKF
ncbi:outer membrane beta-barrel protein [Polynucleobacter paneuropaeus]|nr:outer membrane beta-barrel protein [Polynucleobacter paneuropaeus]